MRHISKTYTALFSYVEKYCDSPTPLQFKNKGFLNYLVYIRPRYLKLLEKKPDSTFWGAIRYIYERPRSDSRRKYLDYDHEEEEGAKRELARWRRRLSRSTSFMNGRLSTRFLSSIQSSAVDDAQDCGDDVQNSANLVAREYYDENGDDDDPDETTQKFTNSSRHQHRSAESLRDKSKEEIFSIEIEQDFPHDEMIAPNNCSVERPRDHSDSAADNKDVRSNNTNNKGRAAQQHQQEVPSAASDDAAYELPPDEAVLNVPPSAPTNDDNDE